MVKALQLKEFFADMPVPEKVVYLGLLFLGYSLPTSHSNAFESGGVVLVLLGCWSLKYLRKDFKLKPNPLYVPLGLFFAVILLSLPWSFDIGESFDSIRSEFLTYTLLFFALSGFCQKREQRYKVMLLLCLGDIFAVSIFCWHMYAVDFNQAKFVSLLSGKNIFNNGPTGASSYFLIFTSFYYAGLFFLKGQKVFFITSALFIVNLGCLFLSYQRASIVALVVVLFMPLVLWRSIELKRVGVLLLVLSCSICLFVVTPISAKFKTDSWRVIVSSDITKLDKNDSLQVRVLIMNHFWQAFKKHPFVGYGYGHSNLKKVDLESADSRPGGLTHAHNSIMNFMFQTGVQGGLAFLFLIFMQVKACVQGFKGTRDPVERFVFVGGLFLLTGFWVRMLFDDVYDSGTALMYWLVMAVVLGLFSRLNAKKEE